MCLRPIAPESVEPERRVVAAHQWNWEGEAAQGDHQHRQQQHQRAMMQRRRLMLDRHRNETDQLLKIKFNCSNHSPCSPIEKKMFGMFASAFECGYLFVATLSALFSIVQPKVKNGLLLVALPLCAIIPAVTGADQQQQPQSERPMEGGANE